MSFAKIKTNFNKKHLIQVAAAILLVTGLSVSYQSSIPVKAGPEGCTVAEPCGLFETDLTYSPTQSLAKRYGGSNSSQAADLILTLKSPTNLATASSVTTCTFKYKFKTSPAYTVLATNVAYTTASGCTATLPKASQTLFNVDFEITAVNTVGSVVENYLMYSNYDFKAGSIGVTSIGGSGI